MKNLKHVADSMIRRLFVRATELGLEKKDLFVITSKEMILSTTRSYEKALQIGEALSVKDFVRQAQRIIESLVIAKEEYPFL